MLELLEYVVAHHFPHFAQLPTRAKAAGFVKEVAERSAQMVACWQSVGFTHGVLNTDNMSILGLTIDYGPFGFMDTFDPQYTPNITDLDGELWLTGCKAMTECQSLASENGDTGLRGARYGRTGIWWKLWCANHNDQRAGRVEFVEKDSEGGCAAHLVAGLRLKPFHLPPAARQLTVAGHGSGRVLRFRGEKGYDAPFFVQALQSLEMGYDALGYDAPLGYNALSLLLDSDGAKQA
ncbi:hypothetical protein CYMTET_30193 [Cymbomonas tetramitiformis]|uniref:Selenoprotein O n=1 Tax=Cymbomonas tetramitiformis TaxID=36881 RepID=A0AAE0FJF2_9CHLO|nr:hypothetical protein CYMTET_30193 [Cymbomonas tetramitiformis]